MAGVRPAIPFTALAVCLLTGSLALAQEAGVAYLAVDLKSGRTIASSRADLLDTPVEPGSIAKIATLAAALESGVVTERTAILCTRTVVVAGRTLTCSHPDLHRPLRPAEALAHSCNVYFATIAGRLPRTSLDAALGALGLMPSHAGRPVAAAALGIDGIRASPRQLVSMMARVGADPSSLPWKAETLRVVRDGLRGAAEYGTASELGARHVSALAKTGTTITASGARGLVVGVTPLVEAGRRIRARGRRAARARMPRRLRPIACSRRCGSREDPCASARRRRTVTTSCAPCRIEEYVADVRRRRGRAGRTGRARSPGSHDRTFTLANRGRHAADGFDLCNLTHCQVPRPLHGCDASSRRGHGRQGAAGPGRARGRFLLRLLWRPHGHALGRLARRAAIRRSSPRGPTTRTAASRRGRRI
jgi:penicillin-binding protein 2